MTAKRKFHDETGCDDIEQALRQDRFHSVGQNMLGARGSKVMPWRQKAHGGPKDEEQDDKKKSKQKGDDGSEEDEASSLQLFFP